MIGVRQQIFNIVFTASIVIINQECVTINAYFLNINAFFKLKKKRKKKRIMEYVPI